MSDRPKRSTNLKFSSDVARDARIYVDENNQHWLWMGSPSTPKDFIPASTDDLIPQYIMEPQLIPRQLVGMEPMAPPRYPPKEFYDSIFKKKLNKEDFNGNL
jgi:hypothetical protein